MLARLGQSGGELRAAIERFGAPARLDLNELGDDLELLGLGKADDGGALGVKVKPSGAGLFNALY